MLLYWLLKDIWHFSGTAPMNVFQGGVQTKRFRNRLKAFSENHRIDRTLAKEFQADGEEACARGEGQW